MINKGIGYIGSVWTQVSKRSIHHKEIAKNYPKVNIKDVVLEKPRYGFRKEREPLLSQSVTDTLFPSTQIREEYLKANKPVPIKYRLNSDQIARKNFEKYQEEVALGKPHFKLGSKKIYLPKARICLLRPNAKHTPYQAKFLVPRNFNKMDLRDYLWNVYGLRALNVTTQLLHAKFQRGPQDYARYRGPQFKKMTIDMEEPFIWPDLSEELVSKYKQQRDDEMKTINYRNNIGSDKLKETDAFDGLYNKPQLPNNFVSTRNRKAGHKVVETYKKHAESKADKDLVSKFLNL